MLNEDKKKFCERKTVFVFAMLATIVAVVVPIIAIYVLLNPQHDISNLIRLKDSSITNLDMNSKKTKSIKAQSKQKIEEKIPNEEIPESLDTMENNQEMSKELNTSVQLQENTTSDDSQQNNTVNGNEVKNNYIAHMEAIENGSIKFELINSSGEAETYLTYNALESKINKDASYVKTFEVNNKGELVKYTFKEVKQKVTKKEEN